MSYSFYNSVWSPVWQISFCTLIVLIKHLESLIGACEGYIQSCDNEFFPKRCNELWFYFVNQNFQWLLATLLGVIKSSETTKGSSTALNTFSALRSVSVSIQDKEIQNPKSSGTMTYPSFLFHDKCYWDATLDYSSFSNWDLIQARAILPCWVVLTEAIA